MWYTATLTAYDCLDSVVIVVTVRSTNPGPDGGLTTELEHCATVEGVGEGNPRQWLVDALVSALETL